jgi:hypothetical protein
MINLTIRKKRQDCEKTKHDKAKIKKNLELESNYFQNAKNYLLPGFLLVNIDN